MGLEDIIRRMEQDASEKIAELRHEYTMKRKEIEKNFLTELERINEANRLKALTHKEKIKDQLLSRAKLELRMNLLAEKEKILNFAFDEAKKRLAELPEHEYIDFYRGKLEAINLDSGEIIIGKADHNRLQRVLDPYLKKGNFRLSVSDEFSYGIIIETGRTIYDLRLESIFADLRTNIEDKVANLLFGS